MEQTGTEALMALAAGFRPVPAKIGMERVEEHPEWPLLSRISMRLTASIPMPRFTVRDLLQLKSGELVVSLWPSAEDIPLRLGNVQLSWSEFELVDQRIGVRLTRLA